MQITTGWRQILSQPLVYDMMQRCIGGYSFKRRFLALHLGEAESETVLELGCGTGFVAECMPKTTYTGIDISEKYIAAARQRRLPRAEFLVCDCVRPTTLAGRKFDWILSNGLMHHLTIEQCHALLAESAHLLKTDGKLVGMEPVWTDSQGVLERFIMNRDRGKNILTMEKWQELFARSFTSIHINVVSDSLRIPYSLIVFECDGPRIMPI